MPENLTAGEATRLTPSTGHDRQCLRILRAILEIADLTGALNVDFTLPAPLRIGAGVNTGYAVIAGIPDHSRADRITRCSETR